MNNSTTTEAIVETIGGVIEDLGEVRQRVTAGFYDHQAEATARILDRLSEEVQEAAAMIRAAYS